ncbi:MULTISPECIES: DMT family transporter [Hyphomonas]|jgi:O-acetylserine/cysteine efflux transporter|uniref:DMT family transporter n=1 Tax=Hyphomonas TaxID=85 RepID=UPI003516011F
MSFRDFVLLFAVCLVWGLNIVFTRWVVADVGVPPIFFAATRFAGVAALLVMFLRPKPEDLKMLFLIAMFIGAVHFSLLFIGLQSAEASAASITGQLGAPFSTLMSMAFLGEKIGWRRGLGIMLSFAGVVLIAFDPSSFSISIGLIYIVVAAFVGSVGGILMKRLPPIKALRLQAWVGLFSFAPLFITSGLLETGQLESVMRGGWQFGLAWLFAVVGVSIFGHGGFYSLIKKYDISLLTPLTLMTPIWGVVFGIILLNEPISARLVLGSVISLSGVFVIAVRQNKTLPDAAIIKKLGSGGS